MTTVAERVAKGAAFLDEREPGWDARIDLDTLDLQAPCRCVLGQLATHLDDYDDDWSYRDITDRFGLVIWFWNWKADTSATDLEYGFNADPDVETYDALASEWKRVITARREAGAS
jgi:hypothetical protein